MGADNESIECPVCDRRIDPETTVCPGCGTAFTLQGMDDLERVMLDLDKPAPEPAAAPAAAEPPAKENERMKGRLSKLFKRR